MVSSTPSQRSEADTHKKKQSGGRGVVTHWRKKETPHTYSTPTTARSMDSETSSEKLQKSEESVNAPPTPRIVQKPQQDKNEDLAQEREYTKELQREVNLIYLTNELNHDAAKMLRGELEKEREVREVMLEEQEKEREKERELREVMLEEQEKRIGEYEQKILEVEQKLRTVEKENEELLVVRNKCAECANRKKEEEEEDKKEERSKEEGPEENHPADEAKLVVGSKDDGVAEASSSLVFRLLGFSINTSQSILFAIPGVTFFWNLTLGP